MNRAIAYETVATELSLSSEELMESSLLAYLHEQLRFENAERLVLCRKHGVSSLQELDQLLVMGEVDEETILEDFQRIDYLTHRVRRLRELLEQLDE